MISRAAESKQQYYDVYRGEGRVTPLPEPSMDYLGDGPPLGFEPGAFVYRMPADPGGGWPWGFYMLRADTAAEAAAAFRVRFPVTAFYAPEVLQVYTVGAGWRYIAEIALEMGGTRRMVK